MKMDAGNIMNFRADFTKTVKELEEKYGVKMLLGNISYNEGGFHTKLEVKNRNENGDIMANPQHEAKAKYAFRMAGMDAMLEGKGLDPGGVIGSYFETKNGEIIKVIDFDSKKSRYPLIFIKQDQHGQFKASINIILRRV
jgi:hypothetical protein